MSNEASLASGSRTSVSLFALVALVLAVLIGFAVGYEQGWFRKTFTLYVESASAEGLKPGMAVRLSGIPVGKVQSIELTGNARIRMALHVGENFHEYLHTDTRAKLAREGLFGDAYVVLQSDNSDQPNHLALVDDGARIPFDDGVSLSDLVAQLKGRVFPLLEDFRSLTQKLSDDKGRLQGSLEQSQALIKEFRSSLVLLDSTLQSTGQLTREQIPQSLGHFNRTVDAAGIFLARTEERLSTLTQKADLLVQKYGQTGDQAGKTALELQQLLKESRQALQSLSGDAGALLRNTNHTVDNLQTHWPFTGPAVSPAPAPAGSAASAPAAAAAVDPSVKP